MLTVRLLGQFAVEEDGKPIDIPSRPAQSLLAWLVLHPDVAHRREHLAGLFWPDAGEENAHSNLRHALWRLRRAVPEAFIIADRIAIRWPVNDAWQVDVAAFIGAPETNSADELLSALTAYQGELLPGFYDEWVHLERERLASLYEERSARLLDLLLAEARRREAIDWAERWIAQGRTPEPAYRGLMQAHAGLGNTAAALAAYQRCIDALDRELDVPPSPETDALAEQIRNSQFAIHRSPPLSSPSTLPPVIPSNLPAPTTPLIGRDGEMAQLSALLTSPDHRLVTLLGPGGMGKSRLALAVGHTLARHFPDGVFLVELTSLAGPEGIPRAVGDALGYPYSNDAQPLAQQIARYLRDRRLLLLLDNFEHLLEGAAFLVELLQAASGLRLLVTSRERLRLHAETVFRLEGLLFPPEPVAKGQEIGYSAVALFVACAQRIGHQYEPDTGHWVSICRICRLLEGLPLALILAAAWVNVMTPEEIADEIETSLDFLAVEIVDLPARHRRIRSILEYSWRQLRADEQRTLSRMAIFAGSMSREAAAAVADASLSILDRLLDLALLTREANGRYSKHEIVRQLALEKLKESGAEADSRSALAAYFGDFLHKQAKDIVGPDVLRAVRAIEQEWPNVRLSLLIYADIGNIDQLRRILPSLFHFLNRPDRWQEGAALLARIAKRLKTRVDVPTRILSAQLLAWQGVLLRNAGEPDAGELMLEQSLESVNRLAGETIEAEPERAFILMHLQTPLVVGQGRRAGRDNLDESLRIFQKIGDSQGEAGVLQLLSYRTALSDRLSEAQHLAENSLDIYKALNNPVGKAKLLTQLSLVHDYQGDTERALDLARQARVEAQACGINEAADDNRLAVALIHTGRFAEAQQTNRESIQTIEALGIQTEMLAWRYNTQGRILIHLGEYELAQRAVETAKRIFVDLRNRQHPFFLRTLGLLGLANGDFNRASEALAYNMSWQSKVDDTNQLPRASAHVDHTYLNWCMGKHAEAKQHMRKALVIASHHGTYLVTIRLLPVAGLVAQVCGDQKVVDAVVRLAFCHPYITASRWFATTALDELHRRLAALPAPERAPAEERGRLLDLRQITDELLALLS